MTDISVINYIIDDGSLGLSLGGLSNANDRTGAALRSARSEKWRMISIR